MGKFTDHHKKVLLDTICLDGVVDGGFNLDGMTTQGQWDNDERDCI